MIDKEFCTFELKNGLRVVHRQTQSNVAHCGLILQAGSRDEDKHEEGIAHFIEHSIFKGTTKRRAYHIMNRLDSVGGEIDAYTSKENTCYYASFLNTYYERAIDLLSDISFNSTFPKKELEKEKEVVIDEINLYLDSPYDQIYDDFEDLVFAGHPLGHAVLGSKESVRSFDKNMITSYTSRYYATNNAVFSSVGNISEKKLKRLLEKHFDKLSSNTDQNFRSPFTTSLPQQKIVDRNTHQTHCIFGSTSYGMQNPKRIIMGLLNNVLGGPAMNSILNMKVREKYGFTYNIESNYSVYSDTGIFSIYLGTDPKYLDKCMTAVEKELKKLREKNLSPNRLNMAKQQMKGQIALGRESNSSIMLHYGKSLLNKNNIQLIEEVYQDIDNITADELLEVANENLQPSTFSYLIYEGKK